MPVTKYKKFTYFIGIDVSKDKLDFAAMRGNIFLFHRVTSNTKEDIIQLVYDLKSINGFTISKSVFCMEQTGIYCNPALNSLKKLKANIVLDNAVQIRNSLGIVRNKYDKIDAIRIAQYAYKSREELRLWEPKRLIIQQLAGLLTLRHRLVTMETTLKTRIDEDGIFVRKSIAKSREELCKRTVRSLKADLAALQERIDQLISSDARIKRLVEIVTSVPGVGKVTAAHIIVSTNEFTDIHDPKKFACYAGVAPFVDDSGKIVRKARISSLANKKMKALLHLCALSVLSAVPDIQAYYSRKTKLEGKPKMAVINAIRYKLILRVFACVNQDRYYQKDYVRNAPVPDLAG